MSESEAIINGTKIFSEAEWTEIIQTLSLSPREGQIIRCLFSDEPDKKIAMDLNIAIPTVRTHITRLFRKLQAGDRSDLLLHVFRRFRQNCRKLGCPRQR
jgi:DNA-binding CsgD family transcriptional regulator